MMILRVNILETAAWLLHSYLTQSTISPKVRILSIKKIKVEEQRTTTRVS